MGKVVLITGGAKGIGRAIALELAKNQYDIVINYLTSNQEAECLKEHIIQQYHVRCLALKADVSKEDQVKKMIQEIDERLGGVDILINNAGVWLAGDLTENTYEQISNCIDVNTKGPIYMTKTILPNMYESGHGLIINVCSQASFDSDDFSTVYNASKWAMRGFNRSIQKDVSKKGIKVTGFYPGFMQTNIFKKSGNDYDTSTGLEVEKVAKTIEFIINCDDDVIIPEFGIKDIENY